MAASRSLRIYLFGSLRVEQDGQELARLASAAARSLLAFLIFYHDQSSTRDRLVGVFWPERSDARARRALSQSLWQIRDALGAAANRLAAEPDQVSFQYQAGDWVDVDEFQNLCAASPQQAAFLQRAVELYRADLLEDIYDDWALVERERLRELYLGALERLIAACKQAGNFEQALLYAQRLAAADPLRESAHRELMRLYHLLGRSQAALQQFATLRDVLEKELRVPPGSATVALCREISAAADEVDSPHLPIAPALPPLLRDLSRLPFVGRADERAMLLDALQAAAQGHGGAALVEGEAGVGKTRLVEQAVAEAQWRKFHVGQSKADPLTDAAPYQLWRDALAPLLTPLRIAQLAETVEPHWLAMAARLFPVIAQHLPDLPTLPPEAGQGRLNESLARCLVGLAAAHPVLLVLEDVHWADEASLKALLQVVSFLPTCRALVMLTCRPAEARERDVVWANLEALARVRLSPFDSKEATALIQRALGVNQADAPAAAFAAALQTETGGNALFLVETLKLLLEQGRLSRSEDGLWHLPGKDDPLPTPPSLQELITARLARLSAPLRAVLEWAAVLGEEARFPVLSRAARLDSATLPALEELTQRSFLSETHTGYRFEHDHIREVLYQSIDAARRKELHRRSGDALEAISPERVELLALHYERSGETEKALRYTLQAAGRAEAVYDYGAALAHYRRALAWVNADSIARWDLLSQQEKALHVLSRRKEQFAVLDEMVQLAKALNDTTRLARARFLQGDRQVLAGDPTAALALLNEAAELARAADQPDLEGRCLVAQARAWWRLGDAARCQAAIEEARSLCQQTQNLWSEMHLLNMLGNLHLGLTGNYAKALTYFSENERQACAVNNVYVQASARGNIGITFSLLGCYERSQELLAEALQVMERVGDRLWQSILLVWQGVNWRELGDLTQAREASLKALSLCREIGNDDFEIVALESLGKLALEQGDAPQAAAYFEQARQVAADHQQKMDWALQQSHLASARATGTKSRSACPGRLWLNCKRAASATATRRKSIMLIIACSIN